jgi:protoheme ferro-lyase
MSDHDGSSAFEEPNARTFRLEMQALSNELRDARVNGLVQKAVLYNQPLASTAVYMMKDPPTDAVSLIEISVLLGCQTTAAI